MVEEVLFKGKRKNWKELPKEQWWVEGCYWFRKPFNEYWIITYDGKNELFYEIDIETLCQYTGLTDNNDNKIWENDIVKHYNVIGEPERFTVSQIVWNSQRCMFKKYKPNGKEYFIDSKCIYEVIGNIFDNPELLEGSR